MAITITGTNDEVLVSGAVATGAVVEDGTASAVGTVNFTDVDLTDDHVVSSALQSTDYTSSMGTFTAVETADTTGSGSGGVVSWSYAINNAAAQQLANGQVVTEVHRITIDDQNGDTVTQDVAITITGTNDEVLVSGAVATGAVVEDGTASAVGTVNFTDVDLTDDHVGELGAAVDRLHELDGHLHGGGNRQHHRQRQRWRGELELRDQQRRGAAAGQRPGGDRGPPHHDRRPERRHRHAGRGDHDHRHE